MAAAREATVTSDDSGDSGDSGDGTATTALMVMAIATLMTVTTLATVTALTTLTTFSSGDNNDSINNSDDRMWRRSDSGFSADGGVSGQCEQWKQQRQMTVNASTNDGQRLDK